MNRTALCIRMLALLKVRGRMRIDEIAEALETNPRNVREFRKELEIAGYPIIQTTGRYGGYQLDTSAVKLNCIFIPYPVYLLSNHRSTQFLQHSD